MEPGDVIPKEEVEAFQQNGTGRPSKYLRLLQAAPHGEWVVLRKCENPAHAMGSMKTGKWAEGVEFAVYEDCVIGRFNQQKEQ